MRDQDDVKPYHAKDAAPGQEAADVVAEVLRHAEERERAAREKSVPKGPPKWMLPLTVNLGVLALYFLIAQPDWVVMNPVQDPRSSPEVVQQAKTAIYIAGITRIESYRQANGRLPQTLEEAGVDLGRQGIRYEVQGDTAYLLITTVGGEPIVFDSTIDDPAQWAGPIRIPG